MKRLYDFSPIIFQNIAISTYGYILKKRRHNKLYMEKLNEFKSINLKETDFKKVQLKKLNDFLLFAKDNSPYYSRVLKSLQFPIQSLNQLSNVPILLKEDITENIDQIVTQPKKELYPGETGGTTGKNLTVYGTKEDTEERMAYLDYFKWQHGVEIGEKRASFTGRIIVPFKQKRNIYWRYNAPMKQLLISSYHASSENLRYYIKKLNQFKPVALDGYPSIMIKLAKYAKQNNIPITFKPKAIFPNAETLLDSDRAILEEVFQTKVRNQYASSEGAPFITECVEDSLHLNIETGVFEKLTDEDVSEILVTSFTTHGTPLIRYKIEDSLEFTDEVCTCPNNSPIVKRILGRSSEFLYDTYNNTTFNSASISDITLPIENIMESQFYQKELEEIDVSIKLKNKDKQKSTIKDLEKELSKFFNPSIKLNIQVVENIKIDKSGKTRFIINELPKEEVK